VNGCRIRLGDELCDAIREVAPQEVWVTQGREEALVRWCKLQGIPAKPLHLAGYEDEAE
jgi:putative mRNA 3-end processing factor